ncbi:hypothetical protein NSA23_03660 [Anaerosalibacter massiliensis]|uniref:Uncharacterized protein n=1 Tax=Anaerosalibacter massiliensis TaxID=1347392 RepID=A0A9X2MGF7_9FIRM|nr:hypothetical protein [Anaerosalibacter massiliensis]MCR2043209.1 hypothetical protein [Anaerosalibacter massiliensis]
MKYKYKGEIYEDEFLDTLDLLDELESDKKVESIGVTVFFIGGEYAGTDDDIDEVLSYFIDEGDIEIVKEDSYGRK